MAKRVGIVGLLVASVVVAACGSSGGGSSSTSQSNASANESLKGSSAVFVNFGGSAGKAVKEAFGDPVAAATGLKVTYDGPTDYAKLETQVKTNNVTWTVLEGDPWWALQQCGKLLAPIPANVDQSQVDPRYVAGKCQVPGDTWSLNMGYDPTKFGTDPPKSWADFFDTTKYPGKRAIQGNYPVNGALEGALIADGVPPSKLYPLDLDRAFRKLATIKKDITFFDTGAQAESMMQNHQVAMVASNGNELGYTGGFKPIWNGALVSWDAYIVPKGADMKAASALLKNVLTQKAQSKFATVIPFGGTLTTPLDKPANVTQQYLDWSSALPEHAKQETPLDQQYYADHFDEINSRWTNFAQG